ncbi:MAG: hypothetical protein ABL957_00160 [Parvularculaceae bacterium]
MPLEGLVSSLGLGELLTGDLFLTQVGVLTATAFLFLSSLVLSVMSFRSAASSHKALRAAQDLTAEMRHLTAQVESSARRPSTAPEHGDDSAHDYAAENHDRRSIDLTEDDRAEYAAADLEAAKKAAIEPSALLRGRLRRR